MLYMLRFIVRWQLEKADHLHFEHTSRIVISQLYGVVMLRWPLYAHSVSLGRHHGPAFSSIPAKKVVVSLMRDAADCSRIFRVLSDILDTETLDIKS